MKMTNVFRESVAAFTTGEGAILSLHTADPGTTGASEAEGGAYARQTTTWSAGAIDGTVSGSEVEFTVFPGTFSHVGVRSSSGTYLWSQAFPSPLTFPAEVASPKIRVSLTLTVPQGT